MFYSHGIHATGVDRLIETANVSKRTFYQHFPSKQQLIEDYLRGYEDQGGTPLEQRLSDVDAPPRERLLAIFDPPAAGPFRGCPFHNAAVESAGVLGAVDDIVRAHKLRFGERLAAVAAEAGAPEPQVLARRLMVLFEGATALSTSVGDTSPMGDARAAATILIDRETKEKP